MVGLMSLRKQLEDCHHFLQNETIILVYNNKMSSKIQKFLLKKGYRWCASGNEMISLEKELGCFSKIDPAVVLLRNTSKTMYCCKFFEEYNLEIEEAKEKEEFIVPSFCNIREVEI